MSGKYKKSDLALFSVLTCWLKSSRGTWQVCGPNNGAPSYLLHILCCTCLIYLPFIAVRDLIFFWRSSTVLRKSPVLTSLLSRSSFELKHFWLTLGSNIVANFNAIPSCPGIEVSIISYRLAFRSLRSNLTVLLSQPLIAPYFGI